jgi:hypothetical protein
MRNSDMNALSNTLTDKQALFVRYSGTGASPVEAAFKAGYADPETEGRRMQTLPHIQAAISMHMRRWLQCEAGPQALNVLYALMVDETKDDRLRRACAKDLSQVAGYIPPKATENTTGQRKGIGDMTAEELRQVSRDIMREMSNRAVTVIDSEPDGAQHTSQATDILD